MSEKKRYESIDLIRVICAFGILMMHMQVNGKYNIADGAKPVITFFTNFVFLFMMISAFGLCCGYYERFATGKISLTDFFHKRYVKVLPFFAVLVALDVIMNPTLPELFEAFADLTLSFGFMSNIEMSVIGVGWFLGVIFVFYMIYPFYCCFLINTKRRAWCTLVITLIYNVLCVLYFGQGRRNILFCSMFFVTGGIIYLYREEITSFIAKHKLVSTIVVLAITVIYIALKAHFTKLGVVEYIAQLILFTAWLVLLISVDLRISTSKPIKLLSGISMEIYLSQMVVYRILEKLHLLYLCGHGVLGYVYLILLDSIGCVLFSLAVNKGIAIAGKYLARFTAKDSKNK